VSSKATNFSYMGQRLSKSFFEMKGEVVSGGPKGTPRIESSLRGVTGILEGTEPEESGSDPTKSTRTWKGWDVIVGLDPVNRFYPNDCFLRALMAVVNLLASGDAPEFIRPFLAGGFLSPFLKSREALGPRLRTPSVVW